MNTFYAYISCLRPRQWIKNFLIFVPFLFTISDVWSPADFNIVTDMLVKLGLAFIAFCLTVSSVYILNDLKDKKNDAKHPYKKYRPVASGQVSASMGVGLMLALCLIGISLMWYIDVLLGGMGILYICLNLLYSFGAKNIVLLDAFLVASGYIVRTAAGAVLIGVMPSPWLYIVTACAALFIVFGRRYAELRLYGDTEGSYRGVLKQYSGPLISQLVNITAAASLLSYTLYTIEADNLPSDHSMLVTVPMVAFGLFRYLYLLNNSDVSESPERLIFQDVPLLSTCAVWLVTAILVLWINSV